MAGRAVGRLLVQRGPCNTQRLVIVPAGRRHHPRAGRPQLLDHRWLLLSTVSLPPAILH